MKRVPKSTFWILVVALLSTAAPAFCLGQNTTQAKGYEVRISSSWCSNDKGMIPLRVEIDTVPPRKLQNEEIFYITNRTRSYDNLLRLASGTLTIPAGQTKGTAEILVSSDPSSRVRDSHVFIERNRADLEIGRNDLCRTDTGNGRRLEVRGRSLLLISKHCDPNPWTVVTISRGKPPVPIKTGKSVATAQSFPNLHTLEKLYYQQDTARAGPSGALTVLSRNATMHGVRPADLPESFLAYTSVDQVLISLDEFRALCQSNSQQRSNLESWVAMGGLLTVFNASDYSAGEEVIPLLLGPERKDNAELNEFQWSWPNEYIKKQSRIYIGEVSSYYGNQRNWFDENEWADEIEHVLANPMEKVPNVASVPVDEDFGFTSYLNGYIAVVPGDMSDWTEEQWRILQNATQIESQCLRTNIGLYTGRSNKPMMGIPGVGTPPVVMFRLMLLGFLLVCGPGMLLLLRRWGSLQLIFVLVPLLSLIVCVSLFMYSVLVDGTKQWGRAQTVTVLDHRTNMSVTHARANYYSGSSQGFYDYESDLLCLPSPTDSTLNDFEVQFLPGKNRVQGGDIQVRTPHELVTIHCKSAQERLIVKSTEGSSDLSIQNRLGGNVACAVIRSKDKYFVIENLSDGSLGTAAPMDVDTAATKLAQISKIRSPLIDEFDRPPNYYYGNTRAMRYGFEAQAIGELKIKDLSRLLSKNNSYVAIVDEFPLVNDQIEQVDYKLRFHVIRGQW